MRQSTLARPLRKPFACIASPDATIFSPYMLVHVYIMCKKYSILSVVIERWEREMEVMRFWWCVVIGIWGQG
jgi:hypothetical protein